jgi:uncharacterized membrane protein YeaQ/YmgE (transglycosylase-associated protein family)
MDAFLQDIIFYAVCGWIAYQLLNDSGGGGKRDRLPAAI